MITKETIKIVVLSTMIIVMIMKIMIILIVQNSKTSRRATGKRPSSSNPELKPFKQTRGLQAPPSPAKFNPNPKVNPTP
jgi:hypothetical protein